MTTSSPSIPSARQIDWRFLLPRARNTAFEHLVLLGGSPDVEHMLVDFGVARRVSCAPQRGVPTDAVIALAGTTIALEEATRDLTQDGVLYWEVDRLTAAHAATTPARATRRLARLGLNPAAAYWVKPGFRSRQMYVPLECAGALRWYLDTLFRTPTRLRHTARNAMIAASACCRLSTLAPRYAMTAVRGERRLPAVVERAMSEGMAIPSEVHAMMLAYGETEWNRIVILLFEPDRHTPTFAIKLPRTPEFNKEVEWEHAILETLAADLPASITQSIPRSRKFQWNGLSVSSETCVTGSSLNSRTGPASDGALNDLGLAVGWLTEFHRHTTVERLPARDWMRRHFIEGTRDEYAATFDLTQQEAQLFDAVAASIERLGAETLPIVWQHADLGPPNVYIDAGKIGVIDWETARRGPALSDLLYFAADWSAAAAGRVTDSARRDHFEALYCRAVQPGTLAHSVHTEIARYMRHLDIAPSLVPVLLVVTFVEKALERVRRLTRLGSVGPADRQSNRFVTYVGLLARNSGALFAPAAAIDDRRSTIGEVTVAVATMNRPHELARCVNAVLSGSVLPAELLVIDQSDDSATADMVAASGWDRIVPTRHIRQARRGLAASRNAAITHARCPIVAFTDDDCVPGEAWLAGILAGFDTAERPDAVTGRVLPLGPERPGFYAVSTRASTIRAVYRGRTLPWAVGSGGNTAAKRDWLLRIGGFDERLGAGSPGLAAEDMDLFYRLLRSGAIVRYEPEAVVFHERQDGRRRLASRPSYGYGMGAFCALWARRRDPYAVWILGRWCYDRARALAASCVRGRWRRVHEESLMLRGAMRGLAYGLTQSEG